MKGKFLWFAARGTSTSRGAESPRNRSVRESSKPPRAPRVRRSIASRFEVSSSKGYDFITKSIQDNKMKEDFNFSKKEQDLIDELIINVSHGINWYNTMKKMINLDVTLFIECGMSKSLSQLAKFIEGNYKIYNTSNLSKMFVSNN